MVDTRRSAAAAKRPADDQDKGSLPPFPGEEQQAPAGADPAEAQSSGARRTAGKRAKVTAVEEDSAAKEAAPAADGFEAAAEAAVAGSPTVAPPDTTGLQALTGAMDRLGSYLRSAEAVTNSDGAGHKRSGADKDLSAMLKRAKL